MIIHRSAHTLSPQSLLSAAVLLTDILFRADNAMQAYRGALDEMREDKQASPFAAWTIEQLQVRIASSIPLSWTRWCYALI